jgi:hypothetical protein
VATEPIIVGDANAIGVFRLPEASLKTQGFNIPGPVRAKRAGQAGLEEALAETPRTALLDDLLRNELVIGIGPLEGSFRVICPRDAAHSTGNPGDGSTLYHAPSGFGGSGWLSCMHQGCKAACKTVRQWRREISKRSGEGISATERIT